MRLILKPDWDPSNPYHYHVNGQKVVITPEDWEKYKDDPTFREVRAAVEAEQAAHPEPEYDEVENPIWRKAYQNLVNGVNLKGRSNYLQPLPLGYTRDAKGVPMDAQGNYYLPVETASDKPYFVNLEKGMMGHIVPVRYELLQMPDRTIRQLRQPLPVDKIMNVKSEKDNAINAILNNIMYKTSLKDIFPWGRGYIYLYNGDLLDGWSSSVKQRNKAEKYLTQLLGRDIIFDNYKNIATNTLILQPQEINILKKKLIDFYKNACRENIKQTTEQIKLWQNDNSLRPEDKQSMLNDLNQLLYYNKLVINNLNNIQDPWDPATTRGKHDRPKIYKPSRQEAEKKAVITIGDLEKVGTFAEGGNIDNPPRKKPQGTLISNIIKAKNASSYNERVQNSEDALARRHWFGSKRFLRKHGITYEDFLKQEGPLQNSFLLFGSDKDRYMLEHGYIKGEKEDYGIVRTAVGNEDLPVYQTKPDDINRDYLVPIKTIKNETGIENGKTVDKNWFGNRDAELNNAGHYSSVLYVDGRNPEIFYQKAWDLNDYRPNLINKLGYKAVQTTGYSKIEYPESKKASIIVDKQHTIEKSPMDFFNEYLKEHNLTREVLDDGTVIYALPTVYVKSSTFAKGGKLIKRYEKVNL